MQELIGRTLGHYRVVERIGAGGMGEVYRAHDERLDRDVAIKVLPTAVAQNAERIARFEREAKAVARLDHSNILAIHDFGSEEGVSYSVTELLEGETLRERLEGGALGWHKAAEIGASIADGLAAAHGAGIIHRDVKPDNVFLTSDGRVKVLDFGLARDVAAAALDDTHSPTISMYTDPGAVMGTAGYMSPEQVRGEPVDARSDIFAFGSVLYEMATGRRAFDRDTAAETMTAILREQPGEFEVTGSQTSRELRRIVARCLEKNPEERFQSARDLAYSLRTITSDRGSEQVLSDRPAGAGLRMSGPVALILTLVVVAVVTVAGLWLVARLPSLGKTDAIRSIAVLPLDNLSEDPERDYYADGMTDALTTELGTISALTVVSSRSTLQFKGTDTPIPDIARVLDVDALVSGSVLTSKDRVRIAAQLIDPEDQRVIWSRAYESSQTDTVTLLGEMARAISHEIRVVLTPEEEKRLGRTQQVEAGAREQYLLGKHLMYSEGDMRSVLDHIERAVAIDPSFAEAWAFMAQVVTEMAGDGQMELMEARRRAREALNRALELDPEIAEVYAVLGTLNGDEDSLRHAVELNPSSAFAQLQLGIFLVASNQPEEGFERLQSALRLDPVSFRTRSWVAGAYHYAGLFDRSIALLDAVKEINPHNQPNQFIHIFLGLNYAAKGLYDKAVESCDQAGDSELCGMVYAVAGQTEKARTTLDWMMTNPNVGPCYVAGVYAGLGETDRAMVWISKAVEQDHPWLVFCFMPLVRERMASEPSYQEILQHMGRQGEERLGRGDSHV